VDDQGAADPCTFGAGMVNVAAALGSTAVATRPALSPALLRQSDGTVQIGTDGLLDANRVVWGINGVTDLRVVWGTRVIWGSTFNTLSASRVIWGSTVWMDRVVWGTSTTSVDLTNIVLAGE
jgi:serine protease AprX